jgi:hypothetical protein
MRYRANHSGQAWPGQATEAVLARESLRRFFQVPDLIPRHHESSLEAARHTPSISHAHHFRPLQIPIQDRAGNQYP